jgi:hypothetical protein
VHDAVMQPGAIFKGGMSAKPKAKPRPAPAPKPGPGQKPGKGPSVPLPGYPERKGLDEPTIWTGKGKPSPGRGMGLGLAASIRRR